MLWYRHVGGTDDAIDILLGRGDVIRGVELALATMAIGETCSILVRREKILRALVACCKWYVAA